MAKYECADCKKLVKESDLKDLENKVTGGIKWVCMDCYKAYPDTNKAPKSFEGTTTDDLGTFVPQNGGKIMHIPIINEHDPEED